MSVGIAGGAELSLVGVLVSGLAAVLAYWLAERYATWLAHWTLPVPGRPAHSPRQLRDGTAMIRAGLVPLVAVAVVGSLTSSVPAAVLGGLITATATLGVVGALAGRRCGMSIPRTAAAAGLAASLGLAVIALKFALH